MERLRNSEIVKLDPAPDSAATSLRNSGKPFSAYVSHVACKMVRKPFVPVQKIIARGPRNYNCFDKYKAP